MHRFFVPPQYLKSQSVIMPDHVARQISKILRLKPGNEIKIFDNTGWEYSVQLTEVAIEGVIGHISSRSLDSRETLSNIILYQALLKTDKFELILQKCTELGVTEFIPVQCPRSIPRMSSQGLSETRLTRWKKIVTEAAEQSGRVRIPNIHNLVDFKDACKNVASPAVILSVGTNNNGLRSILSTLKSNSETQSISIFVGPEGGFSEADVNCARQSKIMDISLGKRVLRAETAAIAAVSTILYELGDLGG